MSEWYWKNREIEEMKWYEERKKWYEEFGEPPMVRREEVEEEEEEEVKPRRRGRGRKKPEPEVKPESKPEPEPEIKTEPEPEEVRPPLTRAGLLSYISRTGVDIHLIKDELNRRLDPIDPSINPRVTYEEQISYLENEIIPWATEEVAIIKEEMAERVIEELKTGARRERARMRQKVLKEYGDVIDIIVEEVLRRVTTSLPSYAPPPEYAPPSRVYPETPYYYRSYEEVYESLDIHRKRMLKDLLKDLLR